MICTGPDLNLPNLLELNLSGNDLVHLPPLKYLTRLECAARHSGGELGHATWIAIARLVRPEGIA